MGLTAHLCKPYCAAPGALRARRADLAYDSFHVRARAAQAQAGASGVRRRWPLRGREQRRQQGTERSLTRDVGVRETRDLLQFRQTVVPGQLFGQLSGHAGGVIGETARARFGSGMPFVSLLHTAAHSASSLPCRRSWVRVPSSALRDLHVQSLRTDTLEMRVGSPRAAG